MPVPPNTERLVLKALLAGEVINIDDFAAKTKLNRGTIASVVSKLAGEEGWLHCERIPGPRTRTGGQIFMRYRAQNVRMLQVRLKELTGPPEYDFESVNRAMQFGQPVELPSVLAFKHVLLEGVEPKDPTEVDYIPQLKRG